MRSPPKRPPPQPPDAAVSVNLLARSRAPTILDCGAEAHIVTGTDSLRPHSVTASNLFTEAFSGAKSRVTFTGDHISGLFPNCHVVPQSSFNLVATGPYADHTGHAVVITSKHAFQLENLDFDELASSPNPPQLLIRRLQSTGHDGSPVVKISVIGHRPGPNSLYYTDLLDRSQQPDNIRDRLINSASTRRHWGGGKLLSLPPIPTIDQPLTQQPATKVVPPPSITKQAPPKAQPSAAPQLYAGAAAHPDPTWVTSTTTEKALLELAAPHPLSNGSPVG